MASNIKSKSTAFVTILVTILIVIVLNLISLNVFARWDVTEKGKYSISETSREIIASLDDRLTIKVFFTEDLPAPHNSDRRYLLDLLDDFKAYSNGMMNYEVLDPEKREVARQAASYQIQPVRFDIRGTTKAETILGYKALVLLYAGRQEMMPFIMNMDNFEYEFIKLVKRLQNPAKPKIGFTVGHGEPRIDSGLTVAASFISENFEPVPLATSELARIPDDIEALMVAAPTREFSEYEVYLLDQYLMRGGKIGFFMNGIKIDRQTNTLSEITTGLESLMNHLGVQINRDFVIDKSCYRYTNMRRVEGGVVPETIEVPFFINIIRFNKDHILTKFQKSLTMIGASSLDTTMAVQDGVKREVLFTTTEKSGSISGNVAARLSMISESDYDKSKLPLSVVLSGHFESYFAKRVIPDFNPVDTNVRVDIPEKQDKSIDTRVLVVGNGNFFDDDAANDRQGRFNQNFVFLNNAVDWMAQDEDMISIRSKGNLYNPFEKLVSEKGQTTIKLINIVAMPFLVIVAGLIRWRVKRAAKRRAAA